MWHRGTPVATELFTAYRDEVADRVRNGIGAYAREDYRLFYASMLEDPRFHGFLQAQFGAALVGTPYLPAALTYARTVYDDDPLRALVARQLFLFANTPDWLVNEAHFLRCDGVVGIEPASDYPSALARACEDAGLPFISVPEQPTPMRRGSGSDATSPGSGTARPRWRSEPQARQAASDDAVGSQGRNLVLFAAQHPSENDVVVLAQKRRRLPVAGLGPGEPDREAASDQVLDWPECRMHELHRLSPCQQLWVSNRLMGVRTGAAGAPPACRRLTASSVVRAPAHASISE